MQSRNIDEIFIQIEGEKSWFKKNKHKIQYKCTVLVLLFHLILGTELKQKKITDLASINKLNPLNGLKAFKWQLYLSQTSSYSKCVWLLE